MTKNFLAFFYWFTCIWVNKLVIFRPRCSIFYGLFCSLLKFNPILHCIHSIFNRLNHPFRIPRHIHKIVNNVQ